MAIAIVSLIFAAGFHILRREIDDIQDQLDDKQKQINQIVDSFEELIRFMSEAPEEPPHGNYTVIDERDIC